VLGDGPVRDVFGGEFLDAAPPPPGDLRVDHGALDVRIERGTIVNPVPSQVGLGQCRLQQILGVGAVTGEQQGDSQQCGTAHGDVLAEGGLAVRAEVVLAGLLPQRSVRAIALRA
jgi:hypothetical protein